MMLPAASSLTPGISLLPRLRGPIPERKSKLPTRLACGNAPTGSGARELSNVLLILFQRNRSILNDQGCTTLERVRSFTKLQRLAHPLEHIFEALEVDR